MAAGSATKREFDFRPAMLRVCCGDPVLYLRAMFVRAAEQLAAGEGGVVALDLRHSQVSPGGARTLAKSAGLVVEGEKKQGTELRLEVRKGDAEGKGG